MSTAGFLVPCLIVGACLFRAGWQLESQNESWEKLKSGEMTLKAAQVLLPIAEGERHPVSIDLVSCQLRQQL